jgi:glycosyltransferase involved in cell wall biosynthesis
MIKPKPKILYVSINGYLGGAEKFVVDVVSEHKKNNNLDVEVLFFSEGAALEICKNAGVKTYLYSSSVRLSRPWTIFKAILWMKKLVQDEKIDLLHGTMAYAQILCGAVCSLTKVKNFWYQHGPVGSLLDTFATFFPYDVVAFNSQYLLEQQDKIIKFRAPNSAPVVIAPGFRDTIVNEEDVSQIRKTHLVTPTQKLFVTAGRVTAIKGFHLIIEAIAFIAKQNPEIIKEIKVLIIGSAQQEKDREYENSLKLMVEQNELNKYITFIAFQENINSFYKASDFFLHTTTICESFGLVIGEAMMQQTLVIGSNAGGSREILQHDQNGLSYDTTVISSATKLKNIIIEVMNPLQQSRLQLLRLKGRIDVQTKFSLAKTVKTLESKYFGLLGLKSKFESED